MLDKTEWIGTENPWATLGSWIAYKNPWVTVRHNQVLRPRIKGKRRTEGVYGVIEIPPSVAILALNAQFQVAVVGQWRYTRDRYSWELPIGGSDKSDPDMLVAARRELREETGAVASAWQAVGTLDTCIGVTTDVVHLFVARHLVIAEPEPGIEEDLRLKWVPLEECYERVCDGTITECASVALILKAMMMFEAELKTARSGQ